MIMIPQTPMSHMVREAFIATAEEIGLKWRDMASGAGHVAMILSKIAPVGLIFVPSRDGISHSP
jgi:acetylornithine deacetylase/succinyl-diaminopimelate desuccinylase-like protein